MCFFFIIPIFSPAHTKQQGGYGIKVQLFRLHAGGCKHARTHLCPPHPLPPTHTHSQCIHTHTRTHTHTYTCTHTHAHTRTKTHVHKHAHTHTHTHTHTPLTKTHTHMYTHTHIHPPFFLCQNGIKGQMGFSVKRFHHNYFITQSTFPLMLSTLSSTVHGNN